MKRRRYATRDELAAVLIDRIDPEGQHIDTTAEQVDRTLTALADLGVQVDTLIKIEVYEDPKVHD